MTIEEVNSKRKVNSMLIAIEFTGRYVLQCGNRRRTIYAKCECGKIIEMDAYLLSGGKQRSCGCTRKINFRRKAEFIGESKRIRGIWQLMKFRCYNQKANCYHSYGGRGIMICKEWLNEYSSFLNWSLKNGYKDKLTIDRIDNNIGYCPENCRWVTLKTNCNNRNNCVYIEYGGERKTLQQWSEQIGIQRDRLKHKLFVQMVSIGDLIK